MIGGCYIAYPIDQANLPRSFYDVIERFEKELVGRNLVSWVFDPGDAFTVSPYAEMNDTLPRVNRAALANADLVVAFLPADCASVGVPMEIDRAVSLGKKVIVFSDSKSWMLAGYHPGRVIRFPTFDDASLLQAYIEVAMMEAVTNQRDPDPVHIQITDPAAQVPTRAYADDAGLDLYTTAHTVILPGAFVDVPCGLRVALPSWSWGLVTGRSSALRRKGLLVHSGVIDAGYRGQLYAGAFNLTDEVVNVEEGERIAQLIVMSNSTRHVEPELVTVLPGSERGVNGFGSSGS